MSRDPTARVGRNDHGVTGRDRHRDTVDLDGGGPVERRPDLLRVDHVRRPRRIDDCDVQPVT
jgi:hypothetical protein